MEIMDFSCFFQWKVMEIMGFSWFFQWKVSGTYGKSMNISYIIVFSTESQGNHVLPGTNPLLSHRAG